MPVRLLPIVFSWASCGRKKWLLRMVCLGRIEKKQSYLGALPKQGISCLPFGLLNQDATGTETIIQVSQTPLHLETPQLKQLEATVASNMLILRKKLWFSVPTWQQWSKEILPVLKGAVKHINPPLNKTKLNKKPPKKQHKI